jgi:maleylacetoacetate isomerase
MLQLYTHYRSVSAHRVRIALNYKGVSYKSVFTDLDNTATDRLTYLNLNPQGLVPALLVDESLVITQSAAIMEYLEERYPERPLLPENTELRARIRSFAQVAVADTHPLNNLRVLRYLRDQMDVPWEKRRQWFEHWLHTGFVAMESTLGNNAETGAYCFSDDKPTLADVCLVPQIYLAEKYDVDLSGYPSLRRIYRTCLTLAAFQAAAPETQPDQRP